MRKLLKSKKGVTIMEVVVGSLLFGMVALTLTAAISPLMMAYRRANDLAEFNQVLDAIGNRITSEVSQASSITYAAGTGRLTLSVSAPNDVIFEFVDGQLIRSQLVSGVYVSIPVYHNDFYQGKDLSFVGVTIPSPIPNANPNITINLEVSSRAGGFARSGATITREYAVRPLRMTP